MLIVAGLGAFLVLGFAIGWLFGSAARLGGPEEASEGLLAPSAADSQAA